MLSELHAHHKLSFGQFPAGPDQNSNCFADSADGWHFLTTTSKNAVLGREKQSRNPAGCGECDRQGDTWSWLGVESNRDDPEVATWSAFHLAPGAVEQYPLIFHSPSCSGSLLPYSYSRFGLFINDLPTLCQRNPPLGPRRQQVGPAVLGQASASAPQPDQRHESVRRRILLSSLKQAAHIAASRNQEQVLCCSTEI